jgi:hypothetical protein
MRSFLMAGALAVFAGCAAPGGGGPSDRPAGSIADETTPHREPMRSDPPARPRPQRPLPVPPSSPPDASALASLGKSCPAAGCPAGLTCLEYCGVAGCRPGAVFRTCEIPCRTRAQCPDGLECGVVADGPGRVCLGGGPRRPHGESM